MQATFRDLSDAAQRLLHRFERKLGRQFAYVIKRQVVTMECQTPYGPVGFVSIANGRCHEPRLQLRRFQPAATQITDGDLAKHVEFRRNAYFAPVRDPDIAVELALLHLEDLARREARQIFLFGTDAAKAKAEAALKAHASWWPPSTRLRGRRLGREDGESIGDEVSRGDVIHQRSA